MTKSEFHHALRILMCLDRHDLIEAGVWDSDTEESFAAWKVFRADPFRFFVRAPDSQADALWALIEPRLKTRPKSQAQLRVIRSDPDT